MRLPPVGRGMSCATPTAARAPSPTCPWRGQQGIVGRQEAAADPPAQVLVRGGHLVLKQTRGGRCAARCLAVDGHAGRVGEGLAGHVLGELQDDRAAGHREGGGGKAAPSVRDSRTVWHWRWWVVGGGGGVRKAVGGGVSGELLWKCPRTSKVHRSGKSAARWGHLRPLLPAESCGQAISRSQPGRCRDQPSMWGAALTAGEGGKCKLLLQGQTRRCHRAGP